MSSVLLDCQLKRVILFAMVYFFNTEYICDSMHLL